MQGPLIIALGGRVVGLNKDTGTQIWRNEMQGGGLSWVALAVSETRVFCSASASKIFCIDRFTGETLWSSKTSGLGRATILYEDNKVFVCKSGHTDCFNVQSGALIWSEDLRSLGKMGAAIGLTDNVVQADGKSN